MAENSQKSPPLDEFVCAFNRYEAEVGAFALKDDQGYPWWDMVRYRVQFALCVERGLHGRPGVQPSKKLYRVHSFVNQTCILLRDFARLYSPSVRKSRTLIISRRDIDYLTEIAAAHTKQGLGLIFVSKSGDAPKPHVAIKSQSLQFFTRLAQRMQRVPPEVVQEARRLSDGICTRFDSNLDIFGLISAKYREELVARKLWSFILKRAPTVERVIYVNDDTLKSLVFLARARGIDTEEVQHAYMGKGHIGFSYPPLEDTLATLPKRVIITRDTGDITYPVEKVVRPQRAIRRASVARDIDVLIASSPSRQDETVAVISALVGRGLRLAVKLHPAEMKQHAKVAAQFRAEEVAIYAGDVDFCDLAWRARLFIPINAASTTAFEAAEMQAKVVLVDFGGVKTTTVSDSVASARATSVQDLFCVVEAQLSGAETEIGRSGEVKI
ncbi:MAG: hypothetical protein JJ897_10150 [Marinibacterium sp.]|nr:hypothetical protein [Marinibacterium sp.]